jgi:hypothetical protein
MYQLFLGPDLCSPMYIAVVTIVGIICEAYHVLCASGPFSVHYANAYLESIDFVSIRYAEITLYCIPL